MWRTVVNEAKRRVGQEPLHSGVAEEKIADGMEEADLATRALSSLPERQRLAVFLRYYKQWEREQRK